MSAEAGDATARLVRSRRSANLLDLAGEHLVILALLRGIVPVVSLDGHLAELKSCLSSRQCLQNLA